MAVVLVAALAAPGLSAQEGPDLSGEWTTAPGPAVDGVGLGSGWGDSVTVTQSADTLVLRYAFFGRGDMQPPLRFTFALDGSPTTNRVLMGRGIQTQVSRVRRDGDALVVTTVHHYPDAVDAPASSRVVRRLKLDGPSSLVVETTREGVLGGAASVTRTVYTRK